MEGIWAYRSFSAFPSEWFTEFLEAYTNFAQSLGDRLDSDLFPLAMKDKRKETLALIEQARGEDADRVADMNEGEAVAEAIATASTSRTAHQQQPEPAGFTTADILSEGDMGVSLFESWDAWDYVVYFGIEHLQDPAMKALVSQGGREWCHERHLASDGTYAVDAQGEYKWVRPHHHLARTDIVWPGLREFDQEPIDRTAWMAHVISEKKQGRAARPTRLTHTRLLPTIHQLAGVANIVARGYLDPRAAPHHSHSLLCDDVGVGKTLQGIMAITILNYYRSQSQRYASRPAPIMASHKAPWSSTVDEQKRLWNKK